MLWIATNKRRNAECFFSSSLSFRLRKRLEIYFPNRTMANLICVSLVIRWKNLLYLLNFPLENLYVMMQWPHNPSPSGALSLAAASYSSTIKSQNYLRMKSHNSTFRAIYLLLSAFPWIMMRSRLCLGILWVRNTPFLFPLQFSEYSCYVHYSETMSIGNVWSRYFFNLTVAPQFKSQFIQHCDIVISRNHK